MDRDNCRPLGLLLTRYAINILYDAVSAIDAKLQNYFTNGCWSFVALVPIDLVRVIHHLHALNKLC